MAKKVRNKLDVIQDKRTEKVTVLFSEEECKMLNYYVKKYKHRSRSAFVRRLVMTHVVGELNANYPTLFDQNISDD
ncbi:hypothetical protein [Porphyromonas levii]|uniref:Ribbon-helix-helix protein, CopG family n=1 Tax=Porphyromonas levii TaxID=28114 RepID=A0A4Y8WP59_9PORP|nr:hypothetical protein [Porphyromonas levii]MBR8703608.1 hypothetical protein [Porphyromonas levii]MBR8712644.1 hypothetical protein [Porphyromonas levii]MBR8714742.1 hypothetical protein [Porphyromonas levii]MBR8727226.1 hypothetical protein [Porphyromonas levii]MBR8729503.1 hypothetical protein [Porphyromonas levii]